MWTFTAGAGDLYPFDSKTKELQFQTLSQNLRCLVCQNQSLADSQSFLAHDLKKELYIQVKNDHSDVEILQYFKQRYGDFVLFKPQLYSQTWFLWYAPFLLLSLGVLLWWYVLRLRN